MRFSASECALLKSHAQVLELMAARCEEIMSHRSSHQLQAAALRFFSQQYRLLARQHIDAILKADEANTRVAA